MSNLIKKLTSVNSEENLQMQNLIDDCNRVDRTAYSYFADDCFKDEEDVNTFFLYDKRQLIAAISLFTPRSCEAEVLAYTHPDFRKKGHFTVLLAEAAVELKRRGTEDFLFVCDRRSEDAKNVLDHIGAEYEYTEYSMRLNRSRFVPVRKMEGLEIRPVEKGDIDELVRINSNAFHETPDESRGFINEFFISPRRKFYSLVYNGVIAGMTGVYIEDARYYIHGVCVDESFRGIGLGKQALSFSIEKYFDDKTRFIELDVHAENEGALGLYLKSGFETVSAMDYLRRKID